MRFPIWLCLAGLLAACSAPAVRQSGSLPADGGDAAFQLAAKNGVRAHHWPYGDMAPVPQVTPNDVAHITAYVRGEQRKVGIR